MANRLIFRPVAADELAEAVARYLGTSVPRARRFRAAVRGALADLVADPLRWPVVHVDAREAPVPGFPYAIHYKFRPGRVAVLSVFHASRDPAIWQARV